MSYLPERQKQGYCRIYYRNGDWQDVRSNEFEPLSVALRSSTDPFYDAVDLYGDPVVLRLGEVLSVGECTPESIATFEAERLERLKHETLNGPSE